MFAIGLFITFAGALASWGIEALEPKPALVDSVILAIIIGIALRQLVPGIQRYHAGIDFSAKRLLPLAIILLGARLDFSAVLAVSGQALAINLICVPFAFLLSLLFARWANLPQKIGILVAIGTAICGGSAIVAAAPVIRANHTETSLSVTSITLFGVLAIFCYPLLGASFGMTELQFGVWAGTGIQAVPQVLAAGFAYGQQAGDLSLLVKLVRILLLAPFVFGLSLWQARNSEDRHLGSWTTYVPPFLLGFLAMVILSSNGWIIDIGGIDTKWVLGKTSSFLITMAMVAIGMGTKLDGMWRDHAKVMGVAFAAALILGSVSYAMIWWFV